MKVVNLQDRNLDITFAEARKLITDNPGIFKDVVILLSGDESILVVPSMSNNYHIVGVLEYAKSVVINGDEIDD